MKWIRIAFRIICGILAVICTYDWALATRSNTGYQILWLAAMVVFLNEAGRKQ